MGMNILDLASPPRDVPLLVRGNVLFGGYLSLFGWVFFGFGMFFVWAFVGNVDYSVVHFQGQLATAEGTVTHCEESSFSKDNSNTSENTPIYANHYTFTDSDGRERSDVSYASGEQLEPGKSVTLEFPQGKPELSRIKGMRRSPMSLWNMIVLIFPLVGLVFIVIGLRKGRKAVHLLTYGVQGEGVLIDMQPTRTQINNQTVYKLTFEFVADDGQTYKAVAKTHQTDELEDEETERLLYDPADPSCAVMMDALPGSPTIDETGYIQGGSVLKALFAMAVPLAVIIGNGTYLVMQLMK
ncbi:MAG: DUF3592 domain-containing protein [Phycisphaerae bacterium]|nr:DUF3592 domain-containing protein [Phycisphaerae bacterium]